MSCAICCWRSRHDALTVVKAFLTGLERWLLAVIAAAVLLQMAVQGEIQSFHLVDALSSLQRGVVGFFGVILVLSSLWSFRRAYRFATAKPNPPSDNTIRDE